MSDYSDDSTTIDFSEREKMEMLENWFQRRAEMTSRALKLILLPLIAIILFAVVFWFNYFIPVPSIVLLGLLCASLLAWLVCLLMGTRVLKRVRTGDAIMLRKIRSSRNSTKS
ncbi:MAG: hypothetical protein K8S62_14130 [Candidatus Sabulitectum sp.]|nr:hypothetical protein [Candidatus Sabulitectum sp.]